MISMNEIKFVIKRKEEMGDIIADHWLANNKIPEGEVWVREDWWNDKEKRKRIITHEKVELYLMIHKKLPYEKAHEIANKFEENAVKITHKELKHMKSRF